MSLCRNWQRQTVSPRTGRQDRSSGYLKSDQLETTAWIAFLVMLAHEVTREVVAGNNSQSLIDKTDHAVSSDMFAGIVLLNVTAKQQLSRQR